MARLTDPAILDRYKQALADWRVTGAIIVDEKQALDGLKTYLEGVTQRDFKEALYRFVFDEDGEIKQVKEVRDWWPCNQWDYHYDLCPTINGVKIYVETRLAPRDPRPGDEPQIIVVNIHP